MRVELRLRLVREFRAVVLVTTSVAALVFCAPALRAQEPHTFAPFPPECGRVVGAGPNAPVPAVLKRVEVQFPPNGLRRGYEGIVQVEAAIMPDGQLCGVRVSRSLDKDFGMDQAAVDAIAQWQFAPRAGADFAIGMVFNYGFSQDNRAVARSPYNLWFPNEARGETLPVVVTQTAPEIDAQTKTSGLVVVVEVRGTVQLDGHVKASGLDVIKRSGGSPADGAIVMREILKAVEKWTFRPATNAAGTPIPHDMAVVVHFPF